MSRCKLKGVKIMSLTITLPTRIEQQLESKWGKDLPQKIVESLAAEGYRSGTLSTGEVSEMLGLSINETDGFLKARGLFAFETIEDIEGDSLVLEELLAK